MYDGTPIPSKIDVAVVIGLGLPENSSDSPYDGPPRPSTIDVVVVIGQGLTENFGEKGIAETDVNSRRLRRAIVRGGSVDDR